MKLKKKKSFTFKKSDFIRMRCETVNYLDKLCLNRSGQNNYERQQMKKDLKCVLLCLSPIVPLQDKFSFSGLFSFSSMAFSFGANSA